MKLYSIYDRVSKRFNAPFLAEDDNVAIRSFQFGVKDSPFAMDLELYQVGVVALDNYKHPFETIDSVFVCSFDNLVGGSNE